MSKVIQMYLLDPLNGIYISHLLPQLRRGPHYNSFCMRGGLFASYM